MLDEECNVVTPVIFNIVVNAVIRLKHVDLESWQKSLSFSMLAMESLQIIVGIR